MSRIIYRITTFLIGFMFSASLFAQTDANELSQKLASLDGLSGQFQQTLHDAQGEVLQESSGKFLLKRPGLFRWETQDPFPQLLVSNLENIWLYDPDLEQVTIRTYDSRLSQTPALLLSGDVEQINEHYIVKKVSETKYELTPKGSQDLFTVLVVVFEESQLSKMVLTDSLEQTTTFEFLQTQANPVIDLTQFEFTPPAGTDVIVDN